MKIDFSRALIVVTGASSGLGKSIARELALKEGADVILAARRAERLDELARDISAAGGRAYPVVVDLALPDGPDTLFQEARRIAAQRDAAAAANGSVAGGTPGAGHRPGVFGLVNNAGLTDYGRFAATDRDRIDAIVHVNLSAAIHLCRMFIPLFLARGSGAILNVTSLGGVLPIPYQAVYAASKHALQAFTESLRPELRGSGVVLSVYAPGGVATEMLTAAGLDARFGGSPRLLASPDKVAARVVKLWKRGVSRGFPKGGLVFLVWAVRLLPSGLVAGVSERLFRTKARTRSSARWDARYDKPEYHFGTDPNAFLAGVIVNIPRGRALCIGDGEGRNSVYLAGQGFDTTAMDLSAVGMEKARKLAAERGVRIKTFVSDLREFDLGYGAWDLVVSTSVHLPPRLRRDVHARVVEGLAPGGYLVHVSYGPEQLQYRTGGPSDPDYLPGLELLRREFAGLDFVHAEEIVRDMVEGAGHTGKAAVVQILARKPTLGT